MNARARALLVSAVLIPTLSASLPIPLIGNNEAFAQAQDAITTEARKRFLEGVSLFDQKKYEEARTAFLQAYALKNHPDVLLNLAQSEVLSGHPLDAANHYRDFLSDPATANHPKRAEAEQGLATARTKLGRVQFTVDAPDAELLLDGKKVGSSPMAEAVDVLPGPHVAEARKAGKTNSQGVTATEGKIVIANLTLDAPAAGAAAPVPVTPPPAAPDNNQPAPAPAPTTSESISLSTSNTKREPFVQWATHSPIAYTGAGLTVLGLGLGVGFLIAGNSALSDTDDVAAKIRNQAASDQLLIQQGRSGNPCATPVAVGQVSYEKACSNLAQVKSDNQKTHDTDVIISTVGFVLAGAGVATIVGGYFLKAKKVEAAQSEQPRFTVTPVFGGGVGGLSAIGTF